MEYTSILLDIDESVATLMINRPEARNGITGAVVEELHHAATYLGGRHDLKVVVFTGAGDRFFCPGADLDSSKRNPGDEPQRMLDARFMQFTVLLHHLPQVTIAAINGACAGAGFGWATACDLRIASENAMFATAFLDIGVAGDMGVPWTLPRIVGSGKAQELLYLTGKFDAQAALDMGLVSGVHPVSEFREAVGVAVDRLRSAAPKALRGLKDNLVAAERMSFTDYIDLETERHYQLVTGAEFQAGVAAFLATRGSAQLTFSAPEPDTDTYDEFSLVAENAAEMAIDWPNEFAPSRESFTLSSGQNVSMIRWGAGPPELVFFHGGGQNAHTWDSVIVATGRNALAIDLPGHGHSDRRSDRNYSPWECAIAVAEIMDQLAPDADAVIGMSLGGATLTRLAARRPDLVHHALVVDVTPQVNDEGRVMTPEQRGSVALISGPPTYDSFQEVLDATMSASPNRTAAGVHRGVRHNTQQLGDGRWAWRYDLMNRTPGEKSWVDFTPLWDDVGEITVPTMLMVGGDSVYVLPEDIAEFKRRMPAVRVETVPGAGHAIQSDQPAALVALIDDFVYS
jgi:enoyl-CoA hydratase/carnithine racemase/pimeloyl-ACP methyl ester carboxylesterase